MTTLLLDTHVAHWWSSEPDRLSAKANRAIDAAEEIAVSAISWYELAWLAKHERIEVAVPIGAWLAELARDLRTASITPAIADAAVALPSGFPGDPADRIIYATAVSNGWRLVTKDQRLRGHRHPRNVTVW